MSTSEPQSARRNPWPHRLAWALACGTFPLIWMGGLVTSFRAGMSVPDWPTTYGHWFYPIQAWFWGCFDLFLEHTHRVLAQCVGLTAIAFCVLAVCHGRPGRAGESCPPPGQPPEHGRNGRGTRETQGMRWLAAGVLGGVLLQGTLGGLRVLLDATQPAPWAWLATWIEWLRQFVDGTLLAKIHGCTAPLYFALCTVAVVLTSRRWRDESVVGQVANLPGRRQVGNLPHAVGSVGAAVALPPPATAARGGSATATPTLFRTATPTALAVTLLLYCDIVLGVQLRHYVPDADPLWFQLWVWLKLIVAGAVLAGVVWLVAMALRLSVGRSIAPSSAGRSIPPSSAGRSSAPSYENGSVTTVDAADRAFLVRRARRLLGLFLFQAALGAATWVTNYGWPAWFTEYVWGLQYTVVAKGKLQVQLTTLHVAFGSLTTAAALNWTLWSHRLLRGPRSR